MTSTRTGRDAIRSEIHLSWDGADPWGSAMAAGFGVCEVLHWTGGDVPAEVDYKPGTFGPDWESYPTAMYLELLEDQYITHEDLAYWARVIDRFFDQVPEDQRY